MVFFLLPRRGKTHAAQALFSRIAQSSEMRTLLLHERPERLKPGERFRLLLKRRAGAPETEDPILQI